jgi:16S rRNA (guanine1516-N2)-methyltransferase
VIPDNKSSLIAVLPAESDQYARAAHLASELQIPLAGENRKGFKFLLICSADSLDIVQTDNGKTGPIKAAFTDPKVLYRLKHGGGRRQALARAVGLKKGWQPKVIDATAGLGRDGFILAHLGCRVHLLERSPILAAMLKDGLLFAGRTVQTAETVSRIRITRTDSIRYLQKLTEQNRPDVIYIDPMYPERIKSSLVKKEMRILRALVGDDQDALALLKTALHFAVNRVVLKRPRLAPMLGGLEPSHAITGRSSRFDIYLV